MFKKSFFSLSNKSSKRPIFTIRCSGEVPREVVATLMWRGFIRPHWPRCFSKLLCKGCYSTLYTLHKAFWFSFHALSHQWHQNDTSSSRSETQRWFSSGKLFEILCLPFVTLLPRNPTWSPTRHPIAEGSCFKKSWVSPMQVSKPLLSESASGILRLNDL